MREREPTQIQRGETVRWRRYFVGYSPAEFTLKYLIRGSGTGIDVIATADGDAFVAEITSAQSQTLTEGRYQWQAWLSEIAAPTKKYVAARGELNVRPGFVEGQTSSVDLRTTAQKIVDALEAALLNSASREQLEYEISTPAGARKIRFMTRSEQTSFLKYYKEIVARERAAERVRNGGTFGTSVKVRVCED